MTPPPRRKWTRPQALIAFRLYCNTDFGKLHEKNPHIIALARQLHRTPAAVGMKACNFASLDPRQRQRGITALPNVSQLDEQIWNQFQANPEAVAAEAEEAFAALIAPPSPQPQAPPEADVDFPDGPTDQQRTVRVRRIQGFFRTTVLVSYEQRCALTGLDLPELLCASHIIPWSVSVERRADPRNGLCLNALLDRAFDRGLITFDNDLKLLVSTRLNEDPQTQSRITTNGLQNRKLQLPVRFLPDPEALAYHREHIFQN